MTEQRSVGKFCSIVCNTMSGTSKSLATIPSARLGDGAEAFCLENRRTYRLNTASAFSSSLSPLYITAQGGGAWEMVEYQSDASYQIIGTNTFDAGANIATVSNTWRAMPVGSAFYTPVTSSPVWSMDATTGVLTYGGPSGRKYLFQSTVANSVGAAVLREFFQIVPTQNSSQIGLTSANSASSSSGWGQVAGGTASVGFISNSLILNVTNGATYQLALRVTGGAYPSMFLFGYQLVAQAL